MAGWLGVPLLAAFLLEMLFALRHYLPEDNIAAPVAAGPTEIGALLFRNYVLPFELTSVLILVAILGAVVLAKKHS